MKYLVFTSIILFSTQTITGCSPIIVAGGIAGAGATVASDRRAPDKLIEDQAIEIQATDFIYGNKQFGKQVHISVTSFNGTVLLTGETTVKENIKVIVDKITRMRGVKKVIDVIDVKKLASAGNRSNDIWITSKVKSNIMARKGLLTRTKVVTSASDVYLMGIVTNKEAKQIIKIVSSVGGINKVVALFESKDGTLNEKLSAKAHIKPTEKPIAKLDKKSDLEEEDTFTLQPYVLQPAVRMTNDE